MAESPLCWGVGRTIAGLRGESSAGASDDPSERINGEQTAAAVVLRERDAVGRHALIDWINARVGAKFQRVSDVMLCDDFPRNVAGKTLKRVLQEQYKGGG